MQISNKSFLIRVSLIGLLLFSLMILALKLAADSKFKAEIREVVTSSLERSLNSSLLSEDSQNTVNNAAAIVFVGRAINEQFKSLVIQNNSWYRNVHLQICSIDGMSISDTCQGNLVATINKNNVNRVINYSVYSELNYLSVSTLLILLLIIIMSMVAVIYYSRVHKMDPNRDINNLASREGVDETDVLTSSGMLEINLSDKKRSYIKVNGIEVKMTHSPLVYLYLYAKKRKKNIDDGWIENPRTNKPYLSSRHELYKNQSQHEEYGANLVDALINLMESPLVNLHSTTSSTLSSEGLSSKKLDNYRSMINKSICEIIPTDEDKKLFEVFSFESIGIEGKDNKKFRIKVAPENIIINDVLA